MKLAENFPVLRFHKSSALVAARSQLEEDNASLNDLIKQYWEVEDYSVPRSQTQEEINCELHFQQNYYRLNFGECAVLLPSNKPVTILGDSYTQAKQQL